MSVKFRPISGGSDVSSTSLSGGTASGKPVTGDEDVAVLFEKALELLKKKTAGFMGQTRYVGAASDVYSAEPKLPEALAKAIDMAVARSGLTGAHAEEMRKSLMEVMLQRLKFTDNIA